MPLIELKFNPWKSLTLKGFLVVVGGLLLSHFDVTAIGGTLGPLVIMIVGALLSMLGIRNAIAKNGSGQ